MAVTSHVFRVEPSFENDRPVIDFTEPKNRAVDWLLIDEVLRGVRGAQQYHPVELTVGSPNAPLWDFFSVPGTLGLLSPRAVDLFGAESLRLFDMVVAALDGEQYYFLRPRSPLECLDLEHSAVVRFSTSPLRIKEITRFSFRKDRIPDPTLFCIPEYFGLFGTDSIARQIQRSNLRGFHLLELD